MNSLASVTTIIGALVALAGIAVLLGASVGGALLAAGVAVAVVGLVGIDVDEAR